MFTLAFEQFNPQTGWGYCELTFLASEARAAVEVARRLKEDTNVRGVSLYDFRLVKQKVVKLLPAEEQCHDDGDGGLLFEYYPPEQVGVETLRTPACVIVDLAKLPRLNKKQAEVKARFSVKVVEATAFDLPKRKTKRQRTYGATADKAVAV